ncbi:glycosyltransferase [Flavobacterium luminosum]|uniref:Glycosyltransferase n=1 Tax=Flavobacterium luminosum TaxID=2949086 RepID=A0ABT0TP23_9FLAO|nr:glycosyltransferase [Flavobacterium sp. HXWNR70]MCL9809125.1 glycosyltransferase [Flavobacterium sp. HXWNR70]
MKILQISTGYDISFSGGITNYVRNISTALANENFDVTVLFSQDNGESKKYNYDTISIQTELRPFHLSSVIKNKDLYKLEEILKKLKPDIIHVHMIIDLPLSVLKVFQKYAKLVISLHDYSYICNRIILIDREGKNCVNNNENKKCNTCITYEETIDNRLINFSIRKLKQFLNINKICNSSGHYDRLQLAKKLFSQADAIIAVSNRVKEIYKSNGFDNKNFFVNHIGNYTAEDDFREKFLERPLKNTNEKFRFGFIGNLNYHKGAEIFKEIVQHSTHEFHIYGGIDAKLKPFIESYENVYYHGKYGHNDLESILKNIEIGLVLPIWEDNAPQVVFEFLNSGIPIIATKMGGIPDFINQENGILFEPNQEEIHKIFNFMNSNDIYEFYNKVVNKFEGTKKVKQHMQDLIKIYNSI